MKVAEPERGDEVQLVVELARGELRFEIDAAHQPWSRRRTGRSCAAPARLHRRSLVVDGRAFDAELRDGRVMAIFFSPEKFGGAEVAAGASLNRLWLQPMRRTRARLEEVTIWPGREAITEEVLDPVEQTIGGGAPRERVDVASVAHGEQLEALELAERPVPSLVATPVWLTR